MPQLRGKNVLVTGGAGFIGSHLVDALILEKPAKIIVVDNFFLGKKENLIEAKKAFGPRLKIIDQDATNYAAMENIVSREKIEVVFNLATKALEYSFVNPDDAYMVNVELASVLLLLLRHEKYKTLIHCSSSEAYGTARKIPISEDHPMMPETLYAAGKASADLMVMSYYNNFKLDVGIIRPFNNYGPRQNEKLYAAVIPITIKRILAGLSPVISGDGNQTRDFIFVKDTVQAMIKFYKARGTRGKVINVATGRELKIKDLIGTIVKEMDFKGKILHKPARLADVRRHLGDIKLAGKIIGFKPTTSFRDGISQTIDWYITKEQDEKNSPHQARN